MTNMVRVTEQPSLY